MAELGDSPVEQASRNREDRALLVAFHRGNDAAAEELWVRHAGRLRAQARALAGAEVADDVVQSVFLRVLRLRRRSLRRVKDPAAWLCTLTRHAAFNVRRQRQRTERRELRAERTNTSDVVETDGMSAILDGLPEPCREAVVLRHAYGFTLERLAEALGVSRSTAAARYSKGLALARQRISREEAQGVPYHVG
ncbi:MAG: RNA polymerase sigma factor [Phycisphaerales bacterium]